MDMEIRVKTVIEAKNMGDMQYMHRLMDDFYQEIHNISQEIQEVDKMNAHHAQCYAEVLRRHRAVMIETTEKLENIILL